MKEDSHQKNKTGVSIVTVTNRPDYMENVFSSYESQTWKTKELIIILNNNSMKLSDWQDYAKRYKHVSVYQLPEEVTLGNCLNHGVEKSKYEIVAKFDDDDYYGPEFLREAMGTFEKTNADIVGKRSCYMYNVHTKELRIRFPGRENKRVTILQGGTILAKKTVMEKVTFPDKNVGEGLSFLQRSRAQGYKIYTTSKNNFAYVRHGDENHTWNPSTEYFNKTSKLVGYMDDYKEFVNQWYE